MFFKAINSIFLRNEHCLFLTPSIRGFVIGLGSFEGLLAAMDIIAS